MIKEESLKFLSISSSYSIDESSTEENSKRAILIRFLNEYISIKEKKYSCINHSNVKAEFSHKEQPEIGLCISCVFIKIMFSKNPKVNEFLLHDQIEKRNQLNCLYQQMKDLKQKLIHYKDNFTQNLNFLKQKKNEEIKLLGIFVQEMQQKLLCFANDYLDKIQRNYKIQKNHLKIQKKQNQVKIKKTIKYSNDLEQYYHKIIFNLQKKDFQSIISQYQFQIKKISKQFMDSDKTNSITNLGTQFLISKLKKFWEDIDSIITRDKSNIQKNKKISNQTLTDSKKLSIDFEQKDIQKKFRENNLKNNSLDLERALKGWEESKFYKIDNLQRNVSQERESFQKSQSINNIISEQNTYFIDPAILQRQINLHSSTKHIVPIQTKHSNDLKPSSLLKIKKSDKIKKNSVQRQSKEYQNRQCNEKLLIKRKHSKSLLNKIQKILQNQSKKKNIQEKQLKLSKVRFMDYSNFSNTRSKNFKTQVSSKRVSQTIRTLQQNRIKNQIAKSLKQ